MQKILLIGDAIDTNTEVQRHIEKNLPYQVFSVQDEIGLKAQLDSRVFNLAILNLMDFSSHGMHLVHLLKRSNYSFPVLIMSEKIEAGFQEDLRYLQDVHLLMRPATEKAIVGLVRKLLVAHRVPKQLYRRFNTNQIAQMEALTTGDSILTSMYNLSKGGAYCEYDGQAPMSVGDLFRLKVYLSDTDSEYVFNAKVVWTTTKGRFSGRFGCGFKFVSAKDTYKSLVGR